VTLLAALRAGTREAHTCLEDDLDVLVRCRSPLTYVPLLQAFRSLYAPLERALEASPATGAVVPDFAQRRKTGWLDDDLTALDAPPAPDRPVPVLSSPEDVAGTCYVLEGATLGGAVVVRRLETALPARFFSSYGSHRGAMWSAFRGHLGALDARGVDHDRTVEAARRTFALFAQACA
jgi:heme oxygenase